MYANNIDDVEVTISEVQQIELQSLEPMQRAYKIAQLSEDFVQTNADWYEGTPEQCEVEAHVMAVFYEVYMEGK